MEKVRKSQGMQKMSKLEEIIKSSGLYIFANTHFSQEQADCEAEDLAKKIKQWALELLPEKEKYISFSDDEKEFVISIEDAMRKAKNEAIDEIRKRIEEE